MPELSIDTLNPSRIRSRVSPLVYSQGDRFFQAGAVQIGRLTPQSAICYVLAERKYRVEVQIQNAFLVFKCDCNYAGRGILCEHDVAVNLALHHYFKNTVPSRWKYQFSQVLQSTPAPEKRKPGKSYLLLFSLQNSFLIYPQTWKVIPYILPFHGLESDETELPVTAEAIQQLFLANPHLSSQARPNFLKLVPEDCLNGSEEMVIMANIMAERNRSLNEYQPALPIKDFLTFISHNQSPLFLGDPTQPFGRRIEILDQPGEFSLAIQRSNSGMKVTGKLNSGGLQFTLPSADRLEGDPDALQVIQELPGWVIFGQYLIKLGGNTPPSFLSTFLENSEMVIPDEDVEEFRERFLLRAAQYFQIEGDAVEFSDIRVDPRPRLYLKEIKGELRAELRFLYDQVELDYDPAFPATSQRTAPEGLHIVRIHRQAETEKSASLVLAGKTYGMKQTAAPAKAGTYSLRARVHPVDFLLHHIPALARDGFEIFGEEQLRLARVNRNRPTVSLTVSTGMDWFDVKTIVNFGELEVSPKEIRKVLRKKERFIKLADGTIGEIPPEFIDKYRLLFSFGEESAEGMKLSNHHISLLDELVAESDQASTDPEFERRRQHLLDFDHIAEQGLPAGFTGELRPYQKAGFDWLHFLHQYCFGGCLADDMGLGKTIQILVFLQSLKERMVTDGVQSPPSLLVVPRSLLVNWQREAARFTPDLRFLEYFEKSRDKELENFEQADVVITTYGVMLRDVDVLQDYHFHYLILDESQFIKNPLALTARAARTLTADHRLVLTGTPVENSTMELWSQFAFINPGLLGNIEHFREEFSTPIERKKDENTASLLRKIVFPFILRRTKDQVATELPPRSERIIYCDMDPSQQKLYNRTRDYYRGLVLGILENEGLNNSRFKILEGLLRLRQISNHPRLFDEKNKGESGKFELLLETLETLYAEHHKALVFSQFVQMLRILRRELDERSIPYLYLDGHTQNRQERVDQFQSDGDIPFFLISLKAGGTGLNLTAADYVIHIDPWWNPAVEMQASDRTHRIGQDKPVFVYKLISRDTVEEKIIQLQQQKKNLVDQLISTDASFFKSLTSEEIRVLFEY